MLLKPPECQNLITQNIMLVDGTANINRDWPRFTKTEDNVTNCCLISATLPRLFPNSKYIAIMRNPIEMTYSISISLALMLMSLKYPEDLTYSIRG